MNQKNKCIFLKLRKFMFCLFAWDFIVAKVGLLITVIVELFSVATLKLAEGLWEPNQHVHCGGHKG